MEIWVRTEHGTDGVRKYEHGWRDLFKVEIRVAGLPKNVG